MRGVVWRVQYVRAPPSARLRRCVPIGLAARRATDWNPFGLRPALGAMGHLYADGEGLAHSAFWVGLRAYRGIGDSSGPAGSAFLMLCGAGGRCVARGGSDTLSSRNGPLTDS
jgi:hypothetical protein